MKWLFSVRKATQRFLISQPYHCHRFFGALNPFGWSKPDPAPSSSLYSGRYYSNSKILNATESSYCRLPNNDVKKVDLEIISRGVIKPSSPTPHHLRTFNLSIIDQILYDVYCPSILFLPNTDKASVTDVVTKRSKHLKDTLSQILTRFYPFAGKVKDNLQIECNDEGVYYMEARVNHTLQDFLGPLDDERLRRLLPDKPCTEESTIGNYVIGIQVNIFKCGGIGISTTMSHKIIDGYTYYIFMRAWAAAARGSPETVSPSFVASKIFPNNPCLEYTLPSKLLSTKMPVTKRFVFHPEALASLKAQPVANSSSTHPPTRMEATVAVIWKAAAQAATKVRPFGPQSPHALVSLVNLRNRASPPLPKESIGNLIDSATAICFPSGHLDLPTLMGELRESIAKIDSSYIESLKGEKGHETFNELLKRVNQLGNVTREGDCLIVTSQLNSGVYELDYGWGKPIWFYFLNARVDSRVAVNETLKGGGVEAIVTLSPDEMEIFERDSEILSYASANLSPFQFVG